MERTIPARALVVSGATLVVLAGVGISAPSGSTAGRTAAASGSDHASVARVAVPARRRAPASTPGVRRPAGPARSRHPPLSSVDTRLHAVRSPPASNVATGCTGSDRRLPARDSTSAASRAATLRAVNFVRSMSGLAPVHFSSALNARSQRTALMMSANRALSHTPPRGWRCWTAVGAANARPVQPRTELPVDHLGRPGRALHARPWRRQRRRRPPPLAAQPVQHHDGHRVDATPPTR